MFLAKLDTDSIITLPLRFSPCDFLVDVHHGSPAHLGGFQSTRKKIPVKADHVLTQWISDCAVSRSIRGNGI